MQSVSLDAMLAFKGASLFIKLFTIRCDGFKILCDALEPLPFLHLRAIQSFCSLLSNCSATKEGKGWDVLYIQLQLSFYPICVYIVFTSV